MENFGEEFASALRRDNISRDWSGEATTTDPSISLRISANVLKRRAGPDSARDLKMSSSSVASCVTNNEECMSSIALYKSLNWGVKHPTVTFQRVQPSEPT